MKLMKYKKIFFAISLFFIIPGVISLFLNGLKPSIDFTGGSLLEVVFSEEDIGENIDKIYDQEFIQETVGDIYEVNTVQKSGENQIIIRGKTLSNDQKNMVLSSMEQRFGGQENLLGDDFVPLEIDGVDNSQKIVNEVRFESVGPTLGKELLMKTLVAVFVVATLITFYVWKQFSELKFGVCAIIAMFHDSIILLGCFSLLGYFMGVEVDVLFVTALLTTLSFSVHDTIVVYDRIRELKRKHPRASLEEVSNAAVLETLSRSINNSVTIIIMLLSLVLLGGASIKWFSVALLIGAVAGTYSSTFTAVPLLLVWEEFFEKER